MDMERGGPDFALEGSQTEGTANPTDGAMLMKTGQNYLLKT